MNTLNNYYENLEDKIYLNNEFLSDNTIILLREKYDIKKSFLSQPIQQICFTNTIFSLLMKNGSVVVFGKQLLSLNKISKMFSNNSFFCGITNDNKLSFWGPNFKRQLITDLKMREDFVINSIPNAFVIHNSQLLCLVKNNDEIDVMEYLKCFSPSFKLKIAKNNKKIVYFKKGQGIMKELIPNNITPTISSIKFSIIDKFCNNKSRLINIIKKCIS